MLKLLRSIHCKCRTLPGYYRAYCGIRRIQWSAAGLRTLTVGSWLTYLSLLYWGGRKNQIYKLQMRGAANPVSLRGQTSDALVFEQIFMKEEYRDSFCPECDWVVDAGSNIGLAAVYFLQRYPSCRVLALEPSPQNYEVLTLNLGAYEGRCQTILGAVWTHRTELCLQQPEGTGNEWAVQVTAGKGDTTAYGMTDLITMFGMARISILKIDVEGAEAEIFSADTAWLQKVDLLAIETHGPAAESVVDKACEPVFGRSVRRMEIKTYLR
jgi:FkbM family methyltransferase